MKRNVAIILTLVAVLLCGCPGLASCVISAYSMTTTPDKIIEAMQNAGFDSAMISQMQQSANMTTSMWVARGFWACLALILIAIPVLVGIFTLRAAKKREAGLQ